MDLRVFFFFAVITLIHCKIINLSCEQIKKFVDGHNSRRLQLANGQIPNQPAAVDMKYMIWDPELTAKAESWASRNKFEHNPDTTVPSGRFRTGENIWIMWTSDFNAKLNENSPLEDWFKEHKDYTYGPIKPSDFSNPNKQIGHYTQMAWANTIYVGCAVSQFTSDRNMNSFFVVCNYGPPGNYIGQTPYKKGNKAKRALTCGSESCTSKLYGSRCS